MRTDLLYHHDGVMHEQCEPIDTAIESAHDWLLERGDAHVDLDEMRPATVDDLPDYAAYVWDRLDERIAHDNRFSWDDGGAELDTSAHATESPEYAALRDALHAAIAAHVDLSEAAWQPTGRVLRVYRDGRGELLETP